jgi:transposase
MKIKEVVGIDVSKLTLDCCIHTSGLQKTFSNNPEGIEKMVSWSIKSSDVEKEHLLFVFEHTGLYSHQLIQFLGGEKYLLQVVPGLEIKRSMGITRGKDDKADAKRIALYGYRVREEIDDFKLSTPSLIKLKYLMSMRKKLVIQRAGHMTTLKEQQRIFKDEDLLYGVQREVIKVLDQQIKLLEKEMDKIISQDPILNKQYQLLTSIKGLGKVTARYLIVFTDGFTTFKTWRKFAAYCGIAPFPNQSGTSIRGKTKVSRLAHLDGKALLHLCAVCAIRTNPELRAYYKRRLKSGKNKMSTINIVRNKLLARAFAVAGRGTPYVEIMKYAS